MIVAVILAGSVWSWSEEERNRRGHLDHHHVWEERPPPAERWSSKLELYRQHIPLEAEAPHAAEPEHTMLKLTQNNENKEAKNKSSTNKIKYELHDIFKCNF